MNQRTTKTALRLAAALGATALALAGCGTQASPTAADMPASAGGATFGTQSTSAISGQLVGGGSASTAGANAAPRLSATGGVQVSVNGTNVSAVTNGNGRFLLTGVPNGNLMLRIVGNGNNASLMLQGVAAHQLIEITIQVQGSAASVLAEDREELEEFDGEVAAVDPAVLGFTLAGGPTLITDANTWWDTGGDLLSFAALADAFGDGLLVHVEGQLVPTLEGALLATVVRTEVEELDVEDLRLDFNRDKWSLGWIGNGSSGNGNSAIVAEIDGGPWFDILGSSVEMEGPSGFVVPFATGFDDNRFEARFTKAQAISAAAGVPPDSDVEIFVRGTLTDGTPWELSSFVKIVDDDDDDDDEGDDDGNELLDPEVAAQAIADIGLAIDYINELVANGEMASNNAHPLIVKLESAIASLGRLQGTPAVNQLGAFLNQLKAFKKNGKIPEENAEFLEESIEEVIDAIEG